MIRVNIGHGRGWLATAAAASVARIDRQFGRPADINDAGRSPEQADENYRRWIAYQNGGPWAPYALPSWESVHCKGEAADSDDWYNAQAAAGWRDNGWRQTARYADDRDEPWHGEYFPNLDNHRNDPAPAGKPEPDDVPEDEEDDMFKPTVHARKAKDGTDDEWTLGHPDFGKELPVFDGDTTTENSRLSADKSIKTFRGFMVTVNRDIFTSWARTYAKGTAQITSRTDRSGYVEIQKQLSLIAGEVSPA